MPRDYMLERVQEFNRILEAIAASKKSKPAKALELIQEAFTATKFKDKKVFDNFSIPELEAFVNSENIDYSSADTIIDILFEEAEIKRDGSVLNELKGLLPKIEFLIAYAAQQEKAEKIFSFKRGYQRERLKTFH
jgi:hypothetical protein